MNQENQAIQDFTKAIELAPKKPFAYYERGNCYSRLSHHKSAIADYNKAIKLKKNYAEAYLARGIIYKKIMEKKKARNDFNSYLKIEGDKATDAEQVRQWIKDLGYKPQY